MEYISPIISGMSIVLSLISLLVAVHRGSPKEAARQRLNISMRELYHQSHILYTTTRYMLDMNTTKNSSGLYFLSSGFSKLALNVQERLTKSLDCGLEQKLLPIDGSTVYIAALQTCLSKITLSDTQSIIDNELFSKYDLVRGILWILVSISSRIPDVSTESEKEKIRMDFDKLK